MSAQALWGIRTYNPAAWWRHTSDGNNEPWQSQSNYNFKTSKQRYDADRSLSLSHFHFHLLHVPDTQEAEEEQIWTRIHGAEFVVRYHRSAIHWIAGQCKLLQICPPKHPGVEQVVMGQGFIQSSFLFWTCTLVLLNWVPIANVLNTKASIS